MHVRRRVLVAGAALAALAAAPVAEASSREVSAGPPVERRPPGVSRDVEANAFYPGTTTVRQGDRVRFQFRGFHNVVFPAGGAPAPDLFAFDAANRVAGATDAAGAPFWFNGQPRVIMDPRSAFPVGGRTINGRGLVSSGLPLQEGPPKPFVARFPSRGTYTYLCTVHPGMRGRVRVVARSSSVPSADRHRRAARRQFRSSVIRARKLNRFQGPRCNRIQAGSEEREVELLHFVHRRRTVRAGTTVTLQMPRDSRDRHTFTFGPEPYLRQITEGFITPEPGGEGPPTFVFNPLINYPSDTLSALPPYTGTNHGNGFFNTGVLDRTDKTPNPGSARVTFTTPGTSGYICLIHPNMKGTVEVR